MEYMDSREEFQSAQLQSAQFQSAQLQSIQQGNGCMWALVKLALVVVLLIFLLGALAGMVVVVMAG